MLPEDYMGKAPCAGGCGRRGYYKYGVCVACRPKCSICDIRMSAPLDTKAHQECIDKKRKEESEGVKGTPGYIYNGVVRPKHRSKKEKEDAKRRFIGRD